MVKNIMIQGTSSSAGKSIITMIICRLISNRGYSVAPFKSQNMTRNVVELASDTYIASTQLIQAEASRILASEHLNPVLLMPSSDTGSTVIVNGKKGKHYKAKEYYKKKGELKQVILDSYRELENKHDRIVIEGAGSPAEINLRSDDFVNMGLAHMVKAPVILVGDIERGGVFASIYGTYMILEPDDRARIKGFIINKFRGDLDILQPGIDELESKIGIPCLGVLPYMDIGIEDEDSLLESRKREIADTIEKRDMEIERIAGEFSNHIDIEKLFAIMEKADE